MVDDVLREDEEKTIEVEKESYTIGFFPEGELEVTTNGTYNVSSYATTGVNVQPNLQQKSISVTQNGTQTITADSGYDGLSEAEVNVSVPQPSGEVEITANGTYNVAAYETAEVNISNDNFISATTPINGEKIADTIKIIEDIDMGDVIGGYMFFQGLPKVTKISVKNSGNVITGGQMFGGCPELKEIKGLDMSKIGNTAFMFDNDRKLETIENISFKSATYIANTFQNCTSLTVETLNNILSALDKMEQYSGTKTLKQLALTEEQATTCTTLSNWAALETKGWTTGY